MPDYIIDIFGERCEILDRCGICGEPRFQRPGETGWTCFHAQGCRALNAGAWHVDARCEMEQAKARDSMQIEQRVKDFGSNVTNVNESVGPRRAPSKTAVT